MTCLLVNSSTGSVISDKYLFYRVQKYNILADTAV
ncbi:unknown [Bacteroides sp. CAG:462]|nr:unknown [Bacteroides sp. CAG:462]